MDASLRLLRAFVVVAHEQHLGRAARRLFVTQSALSQDVRKLETRVGARLFERTSRGMELTAAGRVLVRGVEDALASFDGAVRQVELLGDQPVAVTVAFSPSVGNKLMPELIPLLEQSVTRIRVEEREVDTGGVGPAVCRGEYDLGLAHCPDPDPQLKATTLLEERLCVAVSEDAAVADRHRVALEDLGGLALLLWPREVAPTYYDHLIDVCARSGLDPVVKAGPRRAMIRPYLLAEHQAFFLLPTSTITLKVPGVSFVELADPEATVPLCTIRRLSDERSEVALVEGRIAQIARDVVGHG